MKSKKKIEKKVYEDTDYTCFSCMRTYTLTAEYQRKNYKKANLCITCPDCRRR